MASDIIAALSRFSETLKDTEVDGNAKLKVLQTLNDVTLTLNELSQSGVGRTVRRLKSQPGELGLAARDLIIKWKSLLDEHIKLDNISIPLSDPPLAVKRKSEELVSKEIKKKTKKNYHQHEEKTRPSPQISVDSSSGFSFEQVISVPVSTQLPKKKKIKMAQQALTVDVPSTSSYASLPIQSSCRPTRQFTDEILNSLSEDVNRPDTINEQKSGSRFPDAFEDDPDDGNLKFKSKQIMWAPRAKKHTHSMLANNSIEDDDGSRNSSSSHQLHSPAEFQPVSLIDCCLGVLERNISLVDNVGNVPFELFSQVLVKTSAEDLCRIERYNPQFKGLSEDLWKRHVQRDFPEVRGMQPHHNETWASMHTRLVMDRDRRLDMFINRSTNKIKAEKESRRMTLTTEVITPAAFRRRQNARLSGSSNHSSSTNRHQQSESRQRSTPASRMVFKPKNMSRPDLPSSSSASSSNNTGGNGNSSGNLAAGQNRMLSKIRKQFLKGK